MGRKNKRKIPKNRSMSEMLGEEDSIKTMQDVMNIIDNKRREFVEKIKFKSNEDISMNKKLQNVYARKDAQLADEKRKETYIKGINRMQEQEVK